MTGLFLTFEGGDGSGKSTQATLLTDWLVAAGNTVVRTREPGGTELGVELRDIVLHRRGEISPRAEALIYAADRAHHVATKVRPALERGDIVVQDRYFDSSIAYQGAGRGLDAYEIRHISLWAVADLIPDLTILLDLDESIGRARLLQARTQYDRLEAEERDFHTRVREAYLRLAAAEPERFLVLDGAGSIESIAQAVRDRVQPMLIRVPSRNPGHSA